MQVMRLAPTRARVVSVVVSLVLAGACSSVGAPGTGTGGASMSSSASSGATGGASSSASSGATGGSGGTGGGFETCSPGDTRPCYTGPSGTEGLGLCKGGSQTCNASGVGYGGCLGQVLPKPESCFTPGDDNCDGQVNEGCLCVPQSQVACYTGLSGTEGVGICKGGTAVCLLSGMAYGPCVGQIVPQVDNCASPADEDCDGATPPCAGAYALGRAFGSASDEEGLAIAADPSGNILLAGYTVGLVDFGCGSQPGGSDQGGVIVKLDPTGACLWSKRLGDGSSVTGVATGVGDFVYVAGNFTATVDFGGLTLQSAGQSDVFFAKLDPSGAPVWARRFGDGAPQIAAGIAHDDSNNTAVVGTFQGTIDFGGGPFTSQGGNDIFVVKLDSNGTLIWAQTFGDGSNQSAAGVVVDTAYNLTLTGTVSGTVDFGGGVLQSAGLGDAFVAQLDTGGGHLWSRLYGDAKDQAGSAVRADRMGNVFVAGTFDGTLDLGGAVYTTAGGQDAWLVALDPGGNYRWSRQAGGPNTQSATALAVDPFGNVAFGGLLVGTADFGGGPLTSVGSADVFVAKFDRMNMPLWSYRFGDTASQTLKGLAFDPQGALWLTGILVGAADFGGGAVSSAGGEDIFLAKLSQ
jgi:hypothetical protein